MTSQKSPLDSVIRKVQAIYTELAGERASRLDGTVLAEEAMDVIAGALSESYRPENAREIGYHMADWNSNATFLVALHLFPERFTAEEIVEGVGMFLIHAPNHIREACRLTETYVWESFPAD